MPYIKNRNISIYYEVHGSGEPVLLIPGLGTDLTVYAKIMETLAKSYRVIMIDNRGVGKSDKPHSPYTIEIMADDALAVVQSLAIDELSVVGFSMGGRIALGLALEMPKLVRKLVLVSTSARVVPTWRRRVLGLVSRLFGFLDRTPQPYYAFRNQAAASIDYDCTSRLPELQMPTLIMRGSKDKLVPVALTNELEKGLTKSHRLTFKGGHSFFLWSEQAVFLEKIDSYLKG